METLRERNILSQRPDLKRGVAIGESERAGVALDELAAAEEAIAVGQFGVVLEASFLR